MSIIAEHSNVRQRIRQFYPAICAMEVVAKYYEHVWHFITSSKHYVKAILMAKCTHSMQENFQMQIRRNYTEK